MPHCGGRGREYDAVSGRVSCRRRDRGGVVGLAGVSGWVGVVPVVTGGRGRAMKTDRIMCDCGHLESEHSDCTRGYDMDKDGETFCYDCRTEQDRASLKANQRVCQYYISGDGKRLINWPGRVLGRVVSWGRLHPWSRERRYLRVVDCHGQVWSGIGEAGGWATLRKVG